PKARCMRLAGAGHDGLARAIAPIHTMSDGDTLFALATGKAGETHEAPAADFNVLCLMAAEAVERACHRAVRAARGVRLDGLWLPGLADTDDSNA
ncbi:MAG: P1 family peptidase, partial [Ottowia sp.]|nr:P1 family peptidase [Ottowia sp.]